MRRKGRRPRKRNRRGQTSSLLSAAAESENQVAWLFRARFPRTAPAVRLSRPSLAMTFQKVHWSGLRSASELGRGRGLARAAPRGSPRRLGARVCRARGSGRARGFRERQGWCVRLSPASSPPWAPCRPRAALRGRTPDPLWPPARWAARCSACAFPGAGDTGRPEGAAGFASVTDALLCAAKEEGGAGKKMFEPPDQRPVTHTCLSEGNFWPKGILSGSQINKIDQKR